MPTRIASTAPPDKPANPLLAALLAVGLALSLAAAPIDDAQARSKKAAPAAGATAQDGAAQAASQSAHKAKRKKPGARRATQQRSPSQESRAERDRRLYRECRGRPNAGACLGYTQKP